MCRGPFCALLVFLITGVGYCQQSSPESPPPVPQGAAAQAPAAASDARADGIEELKVTVCQLQERLNQLAPAPAEGERKSTWRTSEPCAVGSSPPSSEQPACHIHLSPRLYEDPAHSEGCGVGRPAPSWESPHWENPPWPLNAYWKDGLQIESENEAFRVHVGGTLHLDWGWNAASQAVQFGPGGIGDLQDGAVFRRARIRLDGTMYEHIEWVAEYDFANTVENDSATSTQTIGTPSFVNAWIGVNDIPLVGAARIGWIKEPISFEFMKSGRWLNFMERTPGINSFFERSPGIMLLNTTENERVSWAFDFHHVQNDNFGFGFGDGAYAETGRLTWLPWYEDEGQGLLHLGIGATHRHLDQNETDLRGRPSVRTMPGSLEPSLADTGSIAGSTQDIIDLELAAVYGPWTLQSEYYGSFLHDAVFPNQPPPDGVVLGTLFYQGTYVELLYFLTGEYQPYDFRAATFGRVVPLRNFNIWDGPAGWGAWQLGIRYGYLDLQNKGVNGATLNDIVVGLNWFLNPNAKVQWNLAIDHRESTPSGSSGWTYIFGTRVAIDF